MLLLCRTAAENLAAQRGVSSELQRIARVESKHFSLPFNIKSQVENSNGMPSMLKVGAQHGLRAYAQGMHT